MGWLIVPIIVNVLIFAAGLAVFAMAQRYLEEIRIVHSDIKTFEKSLIHLASGRGASHRRRF